MLSAFYPWSKHHTDSACDANFTVQYHGIRYRYRYAMTRGRSLRSLWALAMTLMRQTTGLLPVLPVSEVFCHEDIPSFSLVAWNVCDRLPLLSDSMIK